LQGVGREAEVKVIFECDKCGRELLRKNMVGIWNGPDDFCPEGFRKLYEGELQHLSCPACHPPQLSYGPITEEMVAEMLAHAWGRGASLSEWCLNTQEQTRKQARAVIRLLKVVEFDGLTSQTATEAAAGYWRAKLIEMARE
jgi:hypothetical protein